MKYTLTTPTAPEPHRSRERVGFFDEDGNPIDLSSLFDDSGETNDGVMAAMGSLNRKPGLAVGA